jgi:hypothetical protein
MAPTKANIMTVALFLAKKAVVEDLRSKGLKVRDFDRAAIERLALAWIKQHPGLTGEAEQCLREWIAQSRRARER